MTPRARVAVLVRVYNRLEDLRVCLETIRTHWTRYEYHLLVVSNGRPSGYEIPQDIRLLADQVRELPQNAGHIRGSAQLLQAGIDCLPDDCDYTILLECDTWIFTDSILARYIQRLADTGGIWASAEWVERYYSLATDVAIVKTAFLNSHPDMCRFERHAEAFVCNYLRAHHQPFIYLRENMPVHIPKLLRTVYNPYHGRNRSFVRAQMVTHHIEDLANGLDDKKLLANITLGRQEFKIGSLDQILKAHRALRRLDLMMPYIPRSQWFKPKKIRQTSS